MLSTRLGIGAGRAAATKVCMSRDCFVSVASLCARECSLYTLDCTVAALKLQYIRRAAIMRLRMVSDVSASRYAPSKCFESHESKRIQKLITEKAVSYYGPLKQFHEITLKFPCNKIQTRS